MTSLFEAYLLASFDLKSGTWPWKGLHERQENRASLSWGTDSRILKNSEPPTINIESICYWDFEAIFLLLCRALIGVYNFEFLRYRVSTIAVYSSIFRSFLSFEFFTQVGAFMFTTRWTYEHTNDVESLLLKYLLIFENQKVNEDGRNIHVVRRLGSKFGINKNYLIWFLKMTSFYKLLNWVTFIFFCTASRREIDWLEVIPHLENLENFYRQIRAQNQSKLNRLENCTYKSIQFLFIFQT